MTRHGRAQARGVRADASTLRAPRRRSAATAFPAVATCRGRVRKRTRGTLREGSLTLRKGQPLCSGESLETGSFRDLREGYDRGGLTLRKGGALGTRAPQSDSLQIQRFRSRRGAISHGDLDRVRSAPGDGNAVVGLGSVTGAVVTPVEWDRSRTVAWLADSRVVTGFSVVSLDGVSGWW